MKKPVLQYDKHGNFLSEYESITAASVVSGIMRCNISRSLRMQPLKVNRYIWKYKEFNKIIDYKYIKRYFTDRRILDSDGNEIKGLNFVTRKRDYIDLRMVFYKLCSDHAYKFTSISCGEFLNQDHATVLHALGKFEYIYHDSLFIYRDLYKTINKSIVDIKLKHKSEIPTARQDVYWMTKKSLILQVLESDEKIEEMTNEIQTLKASQIEVIYETVA